MFRYLVAWLPLFRLERCGWQSSQSVVLVDEERSALRVQVATPPAQAAGIRQGMTLAEARALLPDLKAERLDAHGEQVDLAELVTQLLQVSPTVAPLPPSALVAEISRSAQAVGGERAAVERTRRRLAHLGHQARVGVADDPRTALAVAAWGSGDTQVPRGGGAEALAPLPLHALSLPLADHDLLVSLGVHTVGAFASLAAPAVVGRLGPVGVAAHAVARGQVVAPVLSTWSAEEPLSLAQDLPDPVEHRDALLFVLNALLRDAAAHLVTARQAVVRLTVQFTLADGGVQGLSVRVGSPTRAPRRLLDLLRLRLERVSLAGPVERVLLEVSESTPFEGQQGDLFQHGRTREALADVAARLQDALGPQAVATPVLRSRHRPEAEWTPRLVQPDQLDAPRRRQASLPLPRETPLSISLDHPPADDPVAEWEGFVEARPPSRPTVLLPQRQAVVVRVQGGVPVRVQVDGRWLEAREAEGPERLAGEWWGHPMLREYWRLQLEDGRAAWLCREDGLWLLHGWWD